MASKFNGLNALQVIGLIVGVLLALAVILALNGWIIMLLLGAILPAFGVSTVGFGTSVLIGVGLTIVGSYFKK